MPSAINEPIDPRLAGAELHIVSTHGTKLSTTEESYYFQANTLISPSDDLIFARVAMTKFEFTNFVYNITGSNCVFDFLDSEYGTVPITLDEGYYTVETLFSVLRAMMKSFFTTRGVSLSDTDYAFTQGIGYNEYESLTYTNVNGKLQLYAQRSGGKYLNLISTSMGWFNIFKFTTITPNKTLRGVNEDTFESSVPFGTQLRNTTQNIFVALQSIPSQIITTANSQPNIIGRIPLTSSFGDVQTYMEMDPFYVEVRNPVIQGFTLALYDDSMQPLNLNSSVWTMSLYIDYVPFTLANPDLNQPLNTPYVQNNPLIADRLHNLRRDFIM